MFDGCESAFNLGNFLYRNIFGPVLGSSPAQNPPVLPSMQPGFGGGNSDYYYSDAHRMEICFTCTSKT